MGTNICKNCNNQTNDDFCSKCGHPVILKKIDGNFVIHEIKDTLFTDKGFLYTTKRLLLSPGDSVRHYISEDRSRYVKPVTYLIITSLIFTLISHFSEVDLFTQADTTEFSALNYFRKWIIDSHGYVSIIIDLYMAFWIRIFFRKYNYNFFEIFILMCYLSGIKALIISVSSILQVIAHSNFIPIAIFIATIYCFWAIGQFFDKKKVKSYLTAIFSYILGLFSIVLLLTVVTIIEYLIIR